MESVILVIHLFLALAIIGLVLLQRSEGGGLGIGGGGMGNLASARGTANLLTRVTAICAGCFFVTSLFLGVLAGRQTSDMGLLDAVGERAAVIEQNVEDVQTEGVDEDAVPAAPVNTE
jgi:preprotein translocase subunit SecG